jgi:hypothetical protein
VLHRSLQSRTLLCCSWLPCCHGMWTFECVNGEFEVSSLCAYAFLGLVVRQTHQALRFASFCRRLCYGYEDCELDTGFGGHRS